MRAADAFGLAAYCPIMECMDLLIFPVLDTYDGDAKLFVKRKGVSGGAYNWFWP